MAERPPDGDGDGDGGWQAGDDELGAGAYLVGQYVLGRVLGVGSFGKVKLAEHKFRKGVVRAVKIMEKAAVRVRGLSGQVRREVVVMRKLNHPNVVKIYDVMSTEDKIYIFMELVEGGELFDEILRQKRLSEPAARFYFRQLVCGLAHCHAKGIYHRDLKPENLLLDKNRQLKISDFGLSSLKQPRAGGGGGGDAAAAAAAFREHGMRARGVDQSAISSSLLLHTQCGTPNYVAPEIITASDAQGYSGAKADIWSCGIILYVLVAGMLPFDEQQMDVLFRRILKCEITYPPHFSPALVDLIAALLRIDPQRRLSMKHVAAHPWMTMSDEELAAGSGGGLEDVPPTPPGYVLRMPWEDPAPGGHAGVPVASEGYADGGPEMGGAMHETTTMDSLDFGNVHVGMAAGPCPTRGRAEDDGDELFGAVDGGAFAEGDALPGDGNVLPPAMGSGGGGGGGRGCGGGGTGSSGGRSAGSSGQFVGAGGRTPVSRSSAESSARILPGTPAEAAAAAVAVCSALAQAQAQAQVQAQSPVPVPVPAPGSVPVSWPTQALEEQRALFQQQQHQLLERQAVEHRQLVVAATAAATGGCRPLAAKAHSHDGSMAPPRVTPASASPASPQAFAQPAGGVVAQHQPRRDSPASAAASAPSQAAWLDQEITAATAAGDPTLLDALWHRKLVGETAAASPALTAVSEPPASVSQSGGYPLGQEQQQQVRMMSGGGDAGAALEATQSQQILLLQQQQEILRQQQETLLRQRDTSYAGSSPQKPESSVAHRPAVSVDSGGSVGGRGSPPPSSVAGTPLLEVEDRYRRLQSARMATTAAAEAAHAAQAAKTANQAADVAAQKALVAARAAAAAVTLDGRSVGLPYGADSPPFGVEFGLGLGLGTGNSGSGDGSANLALGAGGVLLTVPPLARNIFTSQGMASLGMPVGPDLTRRVSRSGASFRNRSRSVVVDGVVTGGSATGRGGSSSGGSASIAATRVSPSPPPSLPPSVMSSHRSVGPVSPVERAAASASLRDASSPRAYGHDAAAVHVALLHEQQLQQQARLEAALRAQQMQSSSRVQAQVDPGSLSHAQAVAYVQALAQAQAYAQAQAHALAQQHAQAQVRAQALASAEALARDVTRAKENAQAQAQAQAFTQSQARARAEMVAQPHAESQSPGRELADKEASTHKQWAVDREVGIANAGVVVDTGNRHDRNLGEQTRERAQSRTSVQRRTSDDSKFSTSKQSILACGPESATQERDTGASAGYGDGGVRQRVVAFSDTDETVAGPPAAGSDSYFRPVCPPRAGVEESAIGTDGDMSKQVDPFKMNIPGPSLGPIRPPQQPRLLTKLHASAGAKLKNHRSRGASADNGGDGGSANGSVDGLSVKGASRLAGALALPAQSRRYTQFHSLNPPKKCFDLMQDVLRTYRCSQVQGRSSQSTPDSYKIRCVRVMDKQPVVATIEIYRADGQLTAISFKKKGSVDSKRFIQLFEDVYKAYTQRCQDVKEAEDARDALLSSVEEEPTDPATTTLGSTARGSSAETAGSAGRTRFRRPFR